LIKQSAFDGCGVGARSAIAIKGMKSNAVEALRPV
jgi:hypothetical protein